MNSKGEPGEKQLIVGDAIHRGFGRGHDTVLTVGGFHMQVDIPEDATAEETTDLRADAFAMALKFAATDPKMRAEMIAGETRSDIMAVVWKLRNKLDKESPEVRDRVLAALGMDGLWKSAFPLKAIESNGG